MDTDALISEICRRVMEKAAALEEAGQDTAAPVSERPQAAAGDRDPGRPRILILTEKHGDICHETLENQILAGKYQIECALLKGNECNADDYEAVLVYTLSNAALGKLAAGIFDCPFTRILGEALLKGKKILAAREGVELFRYRDTAPGPYYDRLLENLKLLEESGVVLTPHSRMAALLTGETTEEEGRRPGEDLPAEKEQEKEPSCQEEVLTKKVITERDMAALRERKITRILVGERAIFTDLAKEYASRYGIGIRRSACLEKKGE